MVGGVARGRSLKSPPAGVRPTADRVREALFNALEARGTEFDRMLDVFAGSGALGIEALSRGEGRCDFVESNAKAAGPIRRNYLGQGTFHLVSQILLTDLGFFIGKVRLNEPKPVRRGDDKL